MTSYKTLYEIALKELGNNACMNKTEPCFKSCSCFYCWDKYLRKESK